MRTTVLPAAVALSLLVATACEPVQSTSFPALSDVSSSDADDQVSLVSRSEALTGAEEYDQAPEGDPLDLDSQDDGFYLDVSGEEIDSAGDDVSTIGAEYANFRAGALTVLAADLITTAVVLPPSLAIAITADGTVTQVEPNVWTADNTVTLGGESVTGHFTVAWVGVGWLAEMRVSSDTLDHALWFNGFVAYGGGLGWWDFYADGQLAGVVEWIADGQGNAQFGIAATSGEQAGSWLSYAFEPDTARIDFYSGPEAVGGFVWADADHSGGVSHPDHAAGAESCWDTELKNVACE